MWQYGSTLEPAEPTQSATSRAAAGKRNVTSILQRSAAPPSAATSAPQPQGDANAATAPLEDPFWFASGPTANDRLPAKVQQQMEESFGFDFSDIRIGVGDEATDFGALAFARGDQLQFAPGQYDPNSAAGLELIGHELAHVVQQRQGRATAAQGKGGLVDDASLEAEADAAGARAARGQPAGLGGSTGSSASSAVDAPVQRKASVSIVDGFGEGSFSAGLLLQLLTQYGFDYLKDAATSLLQWGTAGALGYLTDLVLERSGSAVLETIAGLVSGVAPIFAAIGLFRSVAHTLPPALQTLIAFAVGKIMAWILQHVVRMTQDAADAMVNETFATGKSFAEILDWAYATFSGFSSPTSWVYQKVWKWLSSPFRSAPASEAPKPAAEPAEPSEAPASAPAPMLAKDLRYLWLEIDQPSIQEFEREDQDDHGKHQSGGLELPFAFGINLFNTKIEAKVPDKIQIPWSGGFQVTVPRVDVAIPDGLAPSFSAKKLELTEVTFTEQGLQQGTVRIPKISFADDAAVLSDVTATMDKSGLHFSGAGTVKALDTELGARGELHLDKDGAFEKGSLSLTTSKPVTVVPEVLTIAKPELSGAITKEGDIALGVSGDTQSRFSIFDIATKGAHVNYHKGKGSEFSGGVKQLIVTIGERVTLSGSELDLDRRGLRAAELMLTYQHDPSKKSAPEEVTAIGGISPDLLSFTGLTSLVIAGKVQGVHVGPPPHPLSTSGAQIAKPAEEGRTERGHAEGSRAEPGLRDYFHAESTSAHLSKIGAKALGVTANLDVENRHGDLAGGFAYDKKFGGPEFEFHVVPGVAIFGGLGFSAEAGADVHASADPGPRADTFALSGGGTLKGKMTVTATLGGQLGSALLVALRAGVFGEASAELDATLEASGVLELDREGKRLRASERVEEKPRLHYSTNLALGASVGGVVSAKAFLFFERELYRCEFKKWNLGNYQFGGDYDFDGNNKLADDNGFPGGKPLAPTVEQAPEAAGESDRLLRQAGTHIVGSAGERRKMHRDIRAKYDRVQEAEREAGEIGAIFKQLREQYDEQNQGEEMDERTKKKIAQWQQLMKEHAQAVSEAQQSYDELARLVGEEPSSSNEDIEAGSLDVDGLERNLKRTAAQSERGSARVRQTGQAGDAHLQKK